MQSVTSYNINDNIFKIQFPLVGMYILRAVAAAAAAFVALQLTHHPASPVSFAPMKWELCFIRSPSGYAFCSCVECL